MGKHFPFSWKEKYFLTQGKNCLKRGHNKDQSEQVSQWVILQKKRDGQVTENSGTERLEGIVFRESITLVVCYFEEYEREFQMRKYEGRSLNVH